MDRTEVERKIQVVADRLAAIGVEQAELEAKRRELIVGVADGDAKAEAAIVALDRQSHELQQGRALQEQARAVLSERLAEIEKAEAAIAQAMHVERLHQEALQQVEHGRRLQTAWDGFVAELKALDEHRAQLVGLAYGSGRPSAAPMPATLDTVIDSTKRHVEFMLRGDFRKHLIAAEISEAVWARARPFFKPGFDAASVKPESASAS